MPGNHPFRFWRRSPRRDIAGSSSWRRRLMLELREDRRLLSGGRIAGTKWHDRDGDQTWDAAEQALSNWLV